MRAHEYARAVVDRIAAALKTLTDAGALHISVRLCHLTRVQPELCVYAALHVKSRRGLVDLCVPAPVQTCGPLQVVHSDAPGRGPCGHLYRTLSAAGADGRGGGRGSADAVPLRFDRIHLGHAPDRCGLLATLVATLPLLKASPHALLSHSVACGTTAGDDYEAYTQVRLCTCRVATSCMKYMHCRCTRFLPLHVAHVQKCACMV